MTYAKHPGYCIGVGCVLCLIQREVETDALDATGECVPYCGEDA